MKFQEGDIVYLYITAPSKRVEYKMVVKWADIPLSKAYDDSAYSFLEKPTTFVDSDRFVRFNSIAHVETDDLYYKKLLEHGFKYTMQSDRPVNSEIMRERLMRKNKRLMTISLHQWIWLMIKTSWFAARKFAYIR